jgi:hypothetical protein
MNKSILVAALLAIALSACGKKAEAPAAAPAAGPAPLLLRPLLLLLRLKPPSLLKLLRPLLLLLRLKPPSLLKLLRPLLLLKRSNSSRFMKSGAYAPLFFVWIFWSRL